MKDWKYEGPNLHKEGDKYYYLEPGPQGPTYHYVDKNTYDAVKDIRYKEVPKKQDGGWLNKYK